MQTLLQLLLQLIPTSYILSHKLTDNPFPHALQLFCYISWHLHAISAGLHNVLSSRPPVLLSFLFVCRRENWERWTDPAAWSSAASPACGSASWSHVSQPIRWQGRVVVCVCVCMIVCVWEREHSNLWSVTLYPVSLKNSFIFALFYIAEYFIILSCSVLFT